MVGEVLGVKRRGERSWDGMKVGRQIMAEPGWVSWSFKAFITSWLNTF